MRSTKLLAAATLLTPLLASAQAVPPQVIITFDAVNVSVPLGNWLPAAAAVLLVGATLLWRRRMGTALRSLVLVAAATLAASTALQVRDAGAQGVTYPITLTASPSQTTISNVVGVATNATGNRIRLTSVAITQATGQSSQSCPLSIVTANTTCTAGTELPSGATCQVEVSCPN